MESPFSLHYFRQGLARSALPQLALIGSLAGLMTGVIIVLFRTAIEWPLEHLIPNHDPDNFTSVPAHFRVLLLLAGAAILGALFHFIPNERRRVGIPHVLERLYRNRARLPLINSLTQFGGGWLAIIFGFSVGREGPAVHLGAATSSQLGQWLNLPNNSLRILVGCGSAAAIGAAFNTPFAGVIFAMEVVMMEYSFIGFVPVMLAAVSATLVTTAVYGADPAFNIPTVEFVSNMEALYVLILGCVVGALAAIFVQLVKRFSQFSHYPIWLRFLGCGLLTAVVSLSLPEVMGIGYEIVSDILHEQYGLGLLAALVCMKLLVTSAAVGSGIPGGSIGPCMMIGAAAGAILGQVAAMLSPTPVSSHGMYALLGMGAMMSAALQAPLAALMAVFELTRNPHMILPGMLAVVVANIMFNSVFRQRSLFTLQLKLQGFQLQQDSRLQSLHHVGASSLMNRKFRVCSWEIDRPTLHRLSHDKSDWILLEKDGQLSCAVAKPELSHYLSQLNEQQQPLPARLNLFKIDARCYSLGQLDEHATAMEALQELYRSNTDALALYRQRKHGPPLVTGLLTRAELEQCYLQIPPP